MTEQGYDGGLTRETKWGCVAATIVGALVFAPLLFVDAIGDCAPDTSCRKGFFLMVLLPTLIAAGVAGLLARFLARKL